MRKIKLNATATGYGSMRLIVLTSLSFKLVPDVTNDCHVDQSYYCSCNSQLSMKRGHDCRDSVLIRFVVLAEPLCHFPLLPKCKPVVCVHQDRPHHQRNDRRPLDEHPNRDE